jgi:hypothetical protein|tara:strand:- start:12018 stop:12848 length:831 start_codon:yes stop_codon:yes gene_type:complete
MKLGVNNIVKNKYVLYFVALIAFVDVLGSLMRQEFSAILFFYLSAMIAYFYTKNMTIVLGSALLSTILVRMMKNMFNVKEGLENEMDEDEMDEDEIGDDEKNKVIKRMKLNDKEAKKSKQGTKVESKETDIKKAFKKTKVNDDTGLDIDVDKLDDVSKDASDILKTLEKNGVKSGYQNHQKLNPGLYNIPNKKQLEKQLGKADKMEAAYDNLEHVIGENGIKSMSNSTKELVRQQNELLKGLKDITPALHEAMGAIGKIDLGGLKSMFGSVTSQGE